MNQDKWTLEKNNALDSAIYRADNSITSASNYPLSTRVNEIKRDEETRVIVRPLDLQIRRKLHRYRPSETLLPSFLTGIDTFRIDTGPILVSTASNSIGTILSGT